MPPKCSLTSFLLACLPTSFPPFLLSFNSLYFTNEETKASTLHKLFSTHTGHSLPSLCLYFCLQCLHTSGENCLSNFSSKHPQVIPCQLCLPNRKDPSCAPHGYLAQMSSAPVTEQAFAFPQNCERRRVRVAQQGLLGRALMEALGKHQ